MSLDPSTYSPEDIIVRDVAIIGGGSSGTYSAVRLRDYGHSVAVIEPKDHFGGHAETYTAHNGLKIDIGVVIIQNTKLINNYFSRFNVPLVNFKPSGKRTKPEYVDFNAGRVAAYQPPARLDIAAAYAAYAVQLKKYFDIENGFFPNYPGGGPVDKISTLYALKYLNRGELMSLQNGFLTTANRNIEELYEKALAFLNPPDDNNVFMNSNVISMARSASPAKIVIQTSKDRKFILAKRVLNTALPLPSQLENFDLTEKETKIFSQFYANGYYTGILTNTSLAHGYRAENVGLGKLFDLPLLPRLYSVQSIPGTPDHIQVYYGSPIVLDPATVQSNIISDINKLEALKELPKSNPKWADFRSHFPFNLLVPNEAIENKFYKQLYQLQGERNTFWLGAVWHAQDSSYLWSFAENIVIPKVLASFKTS